MLDWENLKSFLAVAREGNLAAAAKRLGVNQTTMGRRLDALHLAAGAVLLNRTPSGFILTGAGERVLKHIERMESEALATERALSGQDGRLGGLVRVTAVASVATRLITPLIAGLQREHPEIAIELIVDARSLSLARREADIAVRLAPFSQNEAVVRKVGSISVGVFASERYLRDHGVPDWSNGAADHRMIAAQADAVDFPEVRWFNGLAFAAKSSFITNSREAQLSACADGVGLACLPDYMTAGVVSLRALSASSRAPSRGVWLGVHPDMRKTPRVRAILNALATGIQRNAARLAPRKAHT